jgi:ribonuclease P protein component
MSRFGFTAAATLGKAVVRNRIKRRLREAVRSLAVAPGWDVVINSRRGAAEASYDQLRGQVRELMGRARLLQELPE